MTLELSHIENMLAGKLDHVWICSITHRPESKLKFSSGAVYLSKSSLLHILEKHPDITKYEILLLPIAITRGTLYVDQQNPNFLGSIYKSEENKIYFVPMKITSQGHEIWVSSIHRQTKKQLDKKIKKLDLYK